MAVLQPLAPTVREPFAELFDRHFDAVYSYLRRRAGDVAEDLAAETFARALATRERYDAGRGEPRAWLFGIATNVLHGHRRSEARRLRAHSRDAGAAVPPADGIREVARAVDARRAAVTAAHAIRQLSRQDRDVLLLFAWAELSYEEIAAALAIPVGTVRSRLNRSRAKVRAALEAEETR
jgi:RNA polymerase sigma-70 factor (ECF subfamily)